MFALVEEAFDLPSTALDPKYLIYCKYNKFLKLEIQPILLYLADHKFTPLLPYIYVCSKYRTEISFFYIIFVKWLIILLYPIYILFGNQLAAIFIYSQRNKCSERSKHLFLGSNWQVFTIRLQSLSFLKYLVLVVNCKRMERSIYLPTTTLLCSSYHLLPKNKCSKRSKRLPFTPQSKKFFTQVAITFLGSNS